MNKEEILAKSREENQGRSDERELQVFANASKVGMAVGGVVAMFVVIFSRMIEAPLLGLSAWSVYFLMYGSRLLYSFIKTRETNKLIFSGVGIVFGLACLIGMIVLGLK